MPKTKLIYNPRAGSKRRMFFAAPALDLEDIYKLLYKYEIPFDAVGTAGPGDARKLAKKAADAGYDVVIVAGGDGTVGEAANGLIGSNTALAILPLGTYMNVARMLSVPFNLEEAIMVIKMGNIRSIDAGEILYLEQENAPDNPAKEPKYFLESVGIGLEADFQKFFLNFGHRKWDSLVQLIKDARSFYKNPLTIDLGEGKNIVTKAELVMVSNGPFMGFGVPVAPSSKLNDHLLTVTVYKMPRKQFIWHLLRSKIAALGLGKKYLHEATKENPSIQTYTSGLVNITSQKRRPVDADARIFGQTPISLTVKPRALKVIVGFSESKKEAALLEKKTYIRA